MVEGSGPSGGDKGYGDGFANGAGQFEIITIFGTVRIHAGEEDFSGAKADGFAGPFEDINAGGGASSMGVDFPLVGVLGAALGVDGNDDALITEAGGGFFDQGGVVDSSGVEADFIGSGVEHITNIAYYAKAASNGERHEALGGGAFDDVVHDPAFVTGCGDV